MVSVFELSGIKVIMPTNTIKRLDVGKDSLGVKTLVINDIYGEKFAFVDDRIDDVVEDLILEMEMCHTNPLWN